MGGPAMIEGGGLGVVRPEEVGPVAHAGAERRHRHRGRGRDRGRGDGEALSLLFPGPRSPHGPRPDQRGCGAPIPENRLRVYDIRAVVEALADEGSVLELRAAFGLGDRHRARPDRGAAVRPDRQQSEASRRRDRRRRRRQGRALPAALRRLRHARSSRSATRRASWSGRKRRRRRSCAMSAACSSPPRA